MRLVILFSICVLLSSCAVIPQPIDSQCKPIGHSMERCEFKDMVCIIYSDYSISCIPKIDLEDRD